MVALISSCGPKSSDTSSSTGSELAFSLNFFRNAVSSSPADKNVSVSPYSAGVALSMLNAGAREQTEVEIDNALGGCNFSDKDLGQSITVTVTSANSLWINNDFSIRNVYVDLLSKDYDAYADALDFGDPETVRVINNWCSENTNGMIKGIINRLTPDMNLIIANALYFKAPWLDPFEPNDTQQAVFHGSEGDVTVSMMSRTDHMNYAEYQGCQMVELPYKGERYSMYIVLPAAGMSPDKMLSYVNEGLYDQAMSMMNPKKVKLTMPKLKLETSMILNKPLQNMGLKTAFTAAADFKGISQMGPLVLNQVKQKCYIDVSEKGTEAAAVTSVGVRLTSARPEIVVNMNVDRPYLFFISDRTNGNILFAGKVVTL